MKNLYTLPYGASAPEILNVVIEVPANSANKYEYDKDLGVFRLDRVLYAAMSYPGDYGFVPSTLAGDGDPLDVIIRSTHPFDPGVLVEARVIGMLDMTDDKGPDAKILAVPCTDPRFDDIHDLSDMPSHILAEVEHFFAEYKTLEGKQVMSGGWRGRDVAFTVILESIERWKTSGGSYTG